MSSALYHELHKVIGVFERQAKIYREITQFSEDCMEDLQDVCETLRCRRAAALVSTRDLQFEKQQLIEKCNRLERERVSQLKALRQTLGDDASSIYDYFEIMQRSMCKALKRAINVKDWRKVVGLQATLDILTKDKNLIVQIFVEERTGSSNQASFESLYNTSKSTTPRRFSK